MFIIICLFSLFLLNYIYNQIVIYKKNKNHRVEKRIIAMMGDDFSDLINKPQHLINRLISRYEIFKTYYCKLCKRPINHDEFHYSSLAVKSPSKTCIDCMKRNELKFQFELKYVEHFNKRLEDYISEFKKLNYLHYPKTIINTKNIENHFYQKVKFLRKNWLY